MFHNDMFLWNTINDVLEEFGKSRNTELAEKIYKELYGKTWRIKMIESMIE